MIFVALKSFRNHSRCELAVRADLKSDTLRSAIWRLEIRVSLSAARNVKSEDNLKSEKEMAAKEVVPTNEGKQDKVWRRVVELLERNEPQKALELVSPHANEDMQLANLRGVCLMRSGKAEAAVQAYRTMVLSSNGLGFRHDVPVIFKINFATALLLTGNISGALNAISELHEDRNHPAAVRLKAAVDAWFKKLSLLQRLNYWLGGQPSVPVQLDFPAGVIVDETASYTNEAG